jgi:hypothetical protein
MVDGRHGGLDQSCGCARRFAGLFGQITDLIGNHGKAPAGFSSAGSLNRRIEREQIGFEGDSIDTFHDFNRLVGRGFDLLDGLAQCVDGMSPLFVRFQSFSGDQGCGDGVGGGLFYHRGHLGDAGGGFF